MKYSQAIEWAVCILALIAAEKQMVTNEELHRRLKVSSSYLKKITRKLVVGGLIKSSYGSRGGFSLARNMRDITLYDLIESIDGNEAFYQPSGLFESVFPGKVKKVKHGTTLLSNAFYEAQEKMNKKLKKTNMAQLIGALERI